MSALASDLRRLRLAASLCALSGIAALVAHVAGLLAMPYFISFIAVPAGLLLLMLVSLARRLDAEDFVLAMRIGAAGGLLGTLAYDGVRVALLESGIFNYNGFKPILLFGSWMTGAPVESLTAAVGGWLYHFWNGISFGIFYALAAGARHWLFGIGYGLVLEVGMLGLFPFFLHVERPVDFVVLSMTGHFFYGLVLGLFVQRWGPRW